MPQINSIMNYEKIYHNIISAAKDRTLIEYKEKHHIVPRCLNGSNKSDNLVSLTYREHFLCHWLLCKIYPSNHKLKAAFAKMLEITSTKKRIVSSKHFDAVKRQIAGTHFEWLKENLEINGPWNKGKKGVQIPWNKGLKTGPHSAESNKKRSDSVTEHYKNTPHPRSGKDPWNKGKKGVQVPWNKGIEAAEWVCPHCNKIGKGDSNKIRWHFDNCKLKEK